MNAKVYKSCAVPLCKNTSIKTPKKLFVYVPNKKLVRRKWLELARRDPAGLVNNSSIYFCEDHFDLPNDMENYMQYHLMGSVSQVRMKPGCIPHKFACQPDSTFVTVERPYIHTRRNEKGLIRCDKQLEGSSVIIEYLDSDTASANSDSESYMKKTLKISSEDIRKIQNDKGGTSQNESGVINRMVTRKKILNKIRCQRYRNKKKERERKREAKDSSQISKHYTITPDEEEKMKRRREYNKQKSQRYRDKKRASATNLINVHLDQSSKTVANKEHQKNLEEVLHLGKPCSLSDNILTQASLETPSNNQIFDAIFIKEENINTENVNNENEEISYAYEHQNTLNTGNIEENSEKVYVKMENENSDQFVTTEKEYPYQLQVSNLEIQIKIEPLEKEEVL